LILSAVVSERTDFAIIFVLLVVNSTIGYWQEHKADNAIALLKQKLAPLARVKRNGEWVALPARELVPGDIVHVKFGNIVPADLKAYGGEMVEVDQSTLTGESLPVDKEEGALIFMSSIVRKGEIEGAVIGTGINTFFGKTAELVEIATRVSHYQQAVLKIARYIIIVAIILIVIIFIVSILRQETVTDVLKFCLVLTIASIPVALPTVLSVTMAIGAENLARR
jgi:H+-transporting ATPase